MTTFVVVHGGQTGVDRGAHLGALDVGWLIDGFCPADALDERGLIPGDVAEHLTRRGSLSERTRLNVTSCDALVMIVDRSVKTSGTKLTLRLAKERRRLHWIVGYPNDDYDVARQVCEMRLERGTRLMIAGPRASLWPSGERRAREFLGRLSSVLARHG